MTEGRNMQTYRLMGLGQSGKRITIASGITLDTAALTMNEFSMYPLFDRLVIEDENTGESKGEWLRPQPPVA